MSNFINNTQGDFTIIQNSILNSKELTFELKGLYCFLISKPSGWNFSAERISYQTNESESKIKRLLRELENINLLKRYKVKNENGKFCGVNYEILSAVGSNCDVGETTSGKTIGGNCTNISNTNNSNTDYSNINKDISEDISNSDLKDKVFEIWKIYNGKKMSFEIDYEKFLEKTEGVEIDFKRLYKNAIPHNKVYFQTWLNKFFPKSQKNNEQERFREYFIKVGADEDILNDYIAHRKKKRSSFSNTALNTLIDEINKSNIGLNEVFKECINRGWQGFKAEWVNNKQQSAINKGIQNLDAINFQINR